jgi:hypothetical protein
MRSKSWKQLLAEMQGKTAYIRSKVIGPFLGPCASGSYMLWAACFLKILTSYDAPDPWIPGSGGVINGAYCTPDVEVDMLVCI